MLPHPSWCQHQPFGSGHTHTDLVKTTCTQGSSWFSAPRPDSLPNHTSSSAAVRWIVGKSIPKWGEEWKTTAQLDPTWASSPWPSVSRGAPCCHCPFCFLTSNPTQHTHKYFHFQANQAGKLNSCGTAQSLHTVRQHGCPAICASEELICAQLSESFSNSPLHFLSTFQL